MKHSYSVFLSYSRNDAGVAAKLQQRIERFRVPRSIAAELDRPRRLKPVFRDVSDLSSAPDLQDAIRDCLTRSESLVVLCSRHAARSAWVDSEVDFFHSQLGPKDIHAVRIEDGPPAELLPPAFGRNAMRPLGVDYFGSRSDRRIGFVKLMASLVGVDFDTLYKRQVRAARARLCIFVAGATAISLIGALLLRSRDVQFDRAASRQLAQRSQRLLEHDTAAALSLAIAASQRSRTVEAYDALHAARYASCALARIDEPRGIRVHAVSADGLHVVTGSYDRSLRVVEATTGEIQSEYTQFSDRVDFKSSVTSIRMDDNGAGFIAGSTDRSARIFQLEPFRCVSKLHGHSNAVVDVAVDLERGLAATASFDGTAKVWSTTSGAELATFNGHESQVAQVSFLPTPGYVLSVEGNGNARIWNEMTGELVRALPEVGSRCFGTSISPDRTQLARALSPLDDSVTRLQILSLAPNAKERVILVPEIQAQRPVWADDGSCVALMGANSVWLADCTGKEDPVQLSPESEEVPQSVAICSRLSLMAVSVGRSIEVWYLKRPDSLSLLPTRRLTTLYGHSAPPGVLSFDQHSSRLISTDSSGRLSVWDLDWFVDRLTPSRDELPHFSRLADDGTQLITFDHAGRLRLWTTEDTQSPRQLLTSGEPVREAVYVSESETVVASTISGVLVRKVGEQDAEWHRLFDGRATGANLGARGELAVVFEGAPPELPPGSPKPPPGMVVSRWPWLARWSGSKWESDRIQGIDHPTAASIHEERGLVYIGCRDGRVFRGSLNEPFVQVGKTRSQITDLELDPNGRSLVAIGINDALFVNLKTQESESVVAGHASFGSSGSPLVTTEKGGLRVRSPETGRTLRTIALPAARIKALARWSGERDQIAVLFDDDVVRFWNVSDGSILGQSPVRWAPDTMDFTPDGQSLVMHEHFWETVPVSWAQLLAACETRIPEGLTTVKREQLVRTNLGL